MHLSYWGVYVVTKTGLSNQPSALFADRDQASDWAERTVRDDWAVCPSGIVDGRIQRLIPKKCCNCGGSGEALEPVGRTRD
jgi:hypothetical protein